MSLMFKPPAKDRPLDPDLVRAMLDENALLIQIVTEYQNKGKIYECMKYQDILTRNLLYLSGISDFQADENFKPFATEKCVNANAVAAMPKLHSPKHEQTDRKT